MAEEPIMSEQGETPHKILILACGALAKEIVHLLGSVERAGRAAMLTGYLS